MEGHARDQAKIFSVDCKADCRIAKQTHGFPAVGKKGRGMAGWVPLARHKGSDAHEKGQL